MDRFPCNGRLYITLRAGYLECALSHSLKHIHYRDIAIPEDWRQFIRDNYKSGPTTVRVPCLIQSIMTE